MLDIALLEQVFIHGAFAGRIKNLFLDRAMHRQLETDLAREPLLAVRARRALEVLEQLLDLVMILFEQRDRVR